MSFQYGLHKIQDQDGEKFVVQIMKSIEIANGPGPFINTSLTLPEAETRAALIAQLGIVPPQADAMIKRARELWNSGYK